MLQNQHGAGKIAKKWDRTGLVLENLGYNKYRIKVDGSGRVTDRNRQYLRQFTAVTNSQPGPRPETSYTRNPVEEPEYRPVIQTEPEYRPFVQPEPVVQEPQPVQIAPDLCSRNR